MFVLDKLWRGKLSPNEQCCHCGSEYSNLRGALYRLDRQLSSVLSDEKKELFQEYQATQEKMTSISEEDIFYNGFRIGVGLILDALSTYESQFVRYHED